MKPTLIHAYYDIGVAYQRLNEYERALQYYKITLIFQPDHLNALLNFLYLKIKLGQYDDIESFNRILQIDRSFN